MTSENINMTSNITSNITSENRPIIEIIFLEDEDDCDDDTEYEICESYIRIRTSKSDHFTNDCELLNDYFDTYQMFMGGESEGILDVPINLTMNDILKYRYPLNKLTDLEIKEIKDSYESWLKNEDGSLKYSLRYFKIPLLKIKNVVPNEIYDVYSSSEKLSEIKVKEFIKFINKNINIDLTGKQVNNIIQEKFPTVKLHDDKYNVLNMSLPVNSYYLEDSKNVEYLDHDGTMMLLELENGKTMEVWGD